MASLAYLLVIPVAPRLPAWLPEGLIVGMLLGLVLGRLDRTQPAPALGFLIPVLLFGLSAALAVAASVRPDLSLRRAAYAPIAFVVFVAAQEILVSPAAFRRVLATLGVVAGILGLDGVYQAATGASVLGNPPLGRRVAASLPNPNDLALIPILVPAILTFPGLASGSRAAYLLMAGLPPALATAVLSGSRNVWLGLAAALAVLGALRTERRIVAGAAAGAAILFLVAVVFGFGPTPERARTLFDLGDDPRLGYWRVAWQMFRDSPLLGQGLHTFWEFYEPYQARNVIPQGRVPEFVPWPHNLYLEILAERGLVGATVFGVLLAAMVRTLVGALRGAAGPARTVAVGLAAALGAFLVQALFDLTFWKDWPLLVFLLLAAMIARLPTLPRA